MSFESQLKRFSTIVQYITQSTHSDIYLWYLILRGIQNKQKKIKTHPNTKFLPNFQLVGTMNDGTKFTACNMFTLKSKCRCLSAHLVSLDGCVFSSSELIRLLCGQLRSQNDYRVSIFANLQYHKIAKIFCLFALSLRRTLILSTA